MPLRVLVTVGADDDLRADVLGPEGDTTWNGQGTEVTSRRGTHHDLDIGDRSGVDGMLHGHRQARIGDHICSSSDMARFREHDPAWRQEHDLPGIVDEMVASVRSQLG